MSIDLKELAAFLDEANKHTYAADENRVRFSRLASSDIEFKKGDLAYHDTYFGNENFMGEEIVYKNNIPTWGMNYYGYIIDKSLNSEEIYKFLKKALLQERNDMIPVRGPKCFVEGEFEYKNGAIGTLERCSGKEQISKNGKLIYEAIYHGGSIVSLG